MAVDEHSATFAADIVSPERQVLGARYELLGLLGAGGMGNVYKARDIELDEVVALKVLKPHVVAAPGALDRFRREVKLARRVTHPNVARVFDIGEHAGDRVLTMELVDGESLAAAIRREGGLSLARTVEITRAICAGVGAAHLAGVVHRDLKPDNVLIARDGRVVVTDFGIARAAAEGTRTVGFVGTPAYMAPEQIDERATIDHRADVYALGAVVFEMLTGEAAWQAESLWALAAARLLQPPPDPRDKRPEIPAALASLVLNCMSREPGARPQTMEEIDRALRSIALPAASATSAPAPRVTDVAIIPTTGSDKRIAVLPFRSSGPPDQDYVADGLTEDLIDALSVARGLRVRSRGAVMQYKDAARDARDVGRELDVTVVVEGSVRRTPAGYRINARLVSVADGFQLWGRTFDVAEADLLAQNDVIARALAEALAVDLATTPARAAASAEAVDLYLRARQAYRGIFSASRPEVMALFDQVLALTPDDPRALAGRAMAGAMQWTWSPEARRRSFETAEKAIHLAPMLADAHAAYGVLRYADGDAAGAVGSLRRALRLDASCAEAHETLGRILAEADRPEGITHLATALALEPTFEFPAIHLWRAYELTGDTERADELLDRARTRGSRAMLPAEARRAFWRRDPVAARALIERIDPSILAHQRARRWLDATATGTVPPAPPRVALLGAEPPPPLRRFALSIEVELHAACDDNERALALLTQLDADGGSDVQWLERCPVLAGLRAMKAADGPRERFRQRAAEVFAAYTAP